MLIASFSLKTANSVHASTNSSRTKVIMVVGIFGSLHDVGYNVIVEGKVFVK